jgi:hypothetical protein
VAGPGREYSLASSIKEGCVHVDSQWKLTSRKRMQKSHFKFREKQVTIHGVSDLEMLLYSFIYSFILEPLL